MIALIFVGDLKYCPYIKKYIQVLQRKNKDYMVYFWNRSGCENSVLYNCKFYQRKSSLAKSKVAKLADFLFYAKWLNREIERDKPEKIIFLSTLSIMLMKPSLIRKYKGKYILDIRDYSYEHKLFFRKQEQKYIRNSFFCCISSPGFKNFLIPDYNYQIVHNFDKTVVDGKYIFRKKEPDQKLKVVWTGVMRYFEYQKNLIDSLGNDSRFEVHYYGNGPELDKYQDYAAKYDNIFIHGLYDDNCKYTLIGDSDIINNCYGSPNKRLLEYAISNKYYDGIIFRIPQIVESGNYKSRIVEKKGLGVAIDPNVPNFADILFNYYHSVNKEIFEENCSRELAVILLEDEQYEKNLERFLNA